MNRSYYSESIPRFLSDNINSILGELTKHHQFTLEEQQRNSWIEQIKILQDQLQNLNSGHILFEYSIPRMGKRVDVVLLYSGFVFVIEFKINETQYHRSDIDQCFDYAIDLKNFQEASHSIPLIPILISTQAPTIHNIFEQYDDGVFKPLLCNSNNLKQTIDVFCTKYVGDIIDPIKWENSVYKPTPTIIEAAQALYQGHSVKELSRSDSGAINLIRTAKVINQIIEKSKKEKIKSICFITGVPGAGKTLAGLNLANERHKFSDDEHAVFLSGNGPLVDVLQEALARNESEGSSNISKKDALRKSKAFIQNIHHFRDDALRNEKPPIEKVVVFDEAQRAWTHKRTASFMQIKKGISDFDMSEPEFLIKIMDRHTDWAVIVCLVGGGQEINTGEAGLLEWFSALKKYYSHWHVYLSTEISDVEYTRGSNITDLLIGIKYESLHDLHLKVSIRSFRSENVSKFVKAILDCDTNTAKQILKELHTKYPFVMTRDLTKARQWLKDNARGNERFGLIASSRGYRLKPHGIYTELKIDAKNWFLNSKDDLRSSFYLEYVATEFDIQGLELDWSCVAWDADLRFENGIWTFNQFRGNNWRKIINEDDKIYLKNAYRVLLTRARQGLLIFIPYGNSTDHTRNSKFYDGTYNYLKEIGLQEI